MNEMVRAALSAVKVDGWLNTILGLGGARDPSADTTFILDAPISDSALEALYVGDHFAARIVEALPGDGLRPGWELVLPGAPEETAAARDAYAAREDELGVAAEIGQGACWGRLFGGALTWIGADDGVDPEEPLDEGQIKTVTFLHTFDRRDVVINSYYDDPAEPKYRRPRTYRIIPRLIGAPSALRARAASPLMRAGNAILVHESRCIMWPGQPTTDQRRAQLVGWDDSVLQRCWDALRQVGEDFGAKSLLLGRVSQAVYKIKNLYGMLAGKDKEHLQTRMEMLEASRSRSRAVVLDTEEDFLNTTQPLSGVELLMDRGLLRLASAASMPVTILMGQAPAGMNATGESDQESWERTVGGWRANTLRERHERITRIILLAKDGPTKGVEPEHWTIKYRPVRSARPLDAANVKKLQAETDGLLIEKGVVTAADVALARCSPSSGGDIVLDEKTLRAQVERQRELANAPPKDNAELGTVGARSDAVIKIITQVTTRQMSRESGKALLVELHRFKPEVADEMLGPETFEPRPSPDRAPPGPPPGSGNGGGAGAQQDGRLKPGGDPSAGGAGG